MTRPVDYLSDDEVSTILTSGLANMGAMTNEQGQQLVAWAEETIVGYALLQLILAGEFGIYVRDDGEIVFKRERE